MELAVAAMGRKADDELQIWELSQQACDYEEYCDRLKNKIRSEIAAGDFHTIIFSNEHCHSRLLTIEALHRLVEVIGLPSENFEIVVYLRRQDRLAVSLFSTRIKLGDVDSVFPPIEDGVLPEYFCFDRLLQLYACVFDRKKIKVRLFEKSRMIGGDVVSDFYDTIGLNMAPSQRFHENASLSLESIIFLTSFNRKFPLIVDGRINELRGPILEAINQGKTGTPFYPSREEAVSFYIAFGSGNSAVASSFFPDLDRLTLFDDDFSAYPEGQPRSELEVKECMQYIEDIWRYWMVRQKK